MSDETPKFVVKGTPEPVPEDPAEAWELELINQYGACFQGPAGEFVLKDLMGMCNVNNSCFPQAEFDPVRAAFLEGQRSVALRCLRYSGRQIFNL